MYDRSEDFAVEPPQPKAFFSLPSQEVYFFFSGRFNAWCYEIIDNTQMDLKVLNQGCGYLLKIDNSSNKPEGMIHKFLEWKYPNAYIAKYSSEENWLLDYHDQVYFKG